MLLVPGNSKSNQCSRMCSHLQDDNQQPLPDEDIHAEVGSFMIGGHDSTASGLQFIFYTLALNPEHQQKCREEVSKLLDGRDYMDW